MSDQAMRAVGVLTARVILGLILGMAGYWKTFEADADRPRAKALHRPIRQYVDSDLDALDRRHGHPGRRVRRRLDDGRWLARARVPRGALIPL